MKNYLFAFAAAVSIFTASCSSPRLYKAPSVEATRAGITASQGRVASAQGKVTKAQTHVTKAQTNAANLRTTTAKLKSELDKDTLDAPVLRLLVAEQNRQIDGLTQELLETQQALAETQSDLAVTQQELAKAQGNASKLQGDIQKQTDTLNATAADLAKTKSAYHKLKFAVIALAMAATVFLIYSVFNFAAFSPPLLYLTIGAPAAIGAFLLFKL